LSSPDPISGVYIYKNETIDEQQFSLHGVLCAQTARWSTFFCATLYIGSSHLRRPFNVVTLRRAKLALGLVTGRGRVNQLGIQPATQINSAWPSLRG